jgi:hypothetical protein
MTAAVGAFGMSLNGKEPRRTNPRLFALVFYKISIGRFYLIRLRFVYTFFENNLTNFYNIGMSFLYCFNCSISLESFRPYLAEALLFYV